MVSAYGPRLLPEIITYETYVGLWLNLPNVWMRPAMAVLHGTAGGLSDAAPDVSVFEAVALLPETADDAAWEAAKARKWAKLKRERGYE